MLPRFVRAHGALSSALLGALLSPSVFGAPGLRGDYFEQKNPPVPGTSGDFVRTDPAIDFVWNGDAPDGTPIFADDLYSERWTGFVHLPASGAWTFTTTSNDGVRLWVDGQLLIDVWTTHAVQDDNGAFIATAGGWLPIRLEHFNQGGAATIRLFFQGPGQTKAIVPATHLDTTFLGNASPDVDAGPMRIVTAPAVQASLLGSASDADGIQQVQWTQVSGPPAVIQSPSSASTVVSVSAYGAHVFELAATDTLGATATDRATVVAYDPASAAAVSGVARKWHKTSVTYTHASSLHESAADNPFLNYRMQVQFAHPESGAVYDVPGFFAADGDAANTSAQSGTKWRAHFVPDRAGTWFFVASFRTGVNVSVDYDANPGVPISFDGGGGSFVVQPADAAAPGFRKKGALRYVGGHHLRFAETNEPFIKGGADSPENFLGYYEFDNTVDTGGAVNDLNFGVHADGLHHFDAHAGDFDAGDPTWLGGGPTPKGQRIIGALNYLAGKGMNSVYFLTFNVDGGDGREVFPWISTVAKYRYDVSKLAQWDVVLDHMTDLGLALNVITQETENDQALSGGGIGFMRTLYYRELIARFGHNLALVWNLGEENTNTDAERRAFAEFIRANDPYDHPITVHTFPSALSQVYTPLLGFATIDGPSMQVDPDVVHSETLKWVDASAAAGHRWFVCNDEQVPANSGVVPDANDFWHDSIRKNALWGNLMGQGSGCEWYFGYAFPHSDLDCEDWRSRDHMWDITKVALDFFATEIPFAEMEHRDELTPEANDFVLARPDHVYAVYRPNGGATTLDVQASTATYSIGWYDARLGGPLQPGTVATVAGPGVVNLGAPPAGGADWVAVVRRQTNVPPKLLDAFVEPNPFVGPSDFVFRVFATDPVGAVDVDRVEVHIVLPTGQYLGKLPLAHDGGDSYSIRIPNVPPLPSGTWVYYAAVYDKSGALDFVARTFDVP